MSEQILEQIRAKKLIAIARGISRNQIADLTQALYEGGIRCIEVAFDPSDLKKEEDTLESIRTVKKEFGDAIWVGAGTVLSVRQVRLASEAGAQYMLSPNVDKAVICETKNLGRISIPGALTPTEAAAAYQYGADLVKLFPAGQMGPEYIKALRAPLSHIPVIAVGGINLENCADFIKAGAAGVGCGGNLANRKWVEEKRFTEITQTAKSYVERLSMP